MADTVIVFSLCYFHHLPEMILHFLSRYICNTIKHDKNILFSDRSINKPGAQWNHLGSDRNPIVALGSCFSLSTKQPGVYTLPSACIWTVMLFIDLFGSILQDLYFKSNVSYDTTVQNVTFNLRIFPNIRYLI